MSSQGTTNKVSLCKAKISKILKDTITKLLRATNDFEVEVDNDTSLYVTLECSDYNYYPELTLTGVTLLRNDKSYENIALFLAQEIDYQVQDLNDEYKRVYFENEYQKDYETIGGQYAYD